MTGEILFKAKRLDTGEWVEGSLLFDGKDNYYIGTAIFRNDNAIDIVKGGRSNGKTLNRFKSIGFVMVDPKTICQYTGLTDKNGKKIWENDIIKYHFGEHTAPIKYGTYQSCFDTTKTQHCGFYVDWDGKKNLRKDLGYWINMIDVEPIGNIFDNQELLEN